jgi:hypothetical protein
LSTSLSCEDVEAQELYEKIYCARGEMENRIKECQLDLFADRTSTASLSANQLRLWFASLTYVLMTALRRMALQGTELAKDQTPEAWRAGDGQRAAHQDRDRVRLPHEGRVHECSPPTVFRRLKRRLKSVPVKDTSRMMQTPGFQRPGAKATPIKVPRQLSMVAHATPFTDRSAGEICALGYRAARHAKKARIMEGSLQCSIRRCG